MKQKLTRQAQLILFCILISLPSCAQKNILKLGNYQVGFKYEYLLDQKREWIPFPFDSTETPKTNVRPIRLAIWYPAENISSTKMQFENYVNPKAPDSYFGKLNEVMKVYDMWSYRGMFNKNKAVIEKLLKFETNSYFNAPGVVGKFPLIVYSSGWFSRSPDNAILAEFFASHGYVVVTVPQLGEGSTIFDFKESEERIMRQVQDLKFILDHVSNNSNVDISKVASMGWSTGGIIALWLSQIDNRVKVTIGLDGSYMFNDSQPLVKKVINNQRPNFPILSFYRGHEKQSGNVNHNFINSLHWADRYTIKVPNATHGEFCDEPYLIDQMDFEWSRKEFNTLEESLKNYYSVIQISKLFLDHLLISRDSITELRDKIKNVSKEKELIFHN